jgi:hypothetical protein
MQIRRLVSTAALFLLATACGGGPSAPDSGAPPASGPTWYKDVLPITQVSCAGCHVSGGIAPFALDTYELARPMALAIANAVENRRMPPWPASATCGGPFVGDRSLTPAQIDTISRWAATGAAEGNKADAPPPAPAVEQLARVDATLQMPQPYTPTLQDDYRCFLLDPALASEKVVTGYDILPGNKKVVHHVIFYIVPRAAAVAKDAADPAPGWQCFGGANVTTEGTLGAWAPGGAAVTFPAGTGIRVKPGQVLAMQVHYNTDNGAEPDQTSVKLQYGTGGERSAYLVPLVADNFNIPAGAVNFAHSEPFPNTLGFDINVWGFLPHMHTLGKRISITAGTSDDCLVEVPRWDFHWQTQYFRKTAYRVPNGAKLKLSCSWDNTTSRAVTWGEGTGDEMCFAFIYATL